MSSKKGKKLKGKTFSLNDFIGDSPIQNPIPKVKSWADDEEDDFSYMAKPKEPVVLPTAPRAARDSSYNEENVPANPPYIAYISNLPYDVEEEDICEFFGNMKVSSMRLPKESNKFKGYGYVEFEDRQSLIDALSMPDTNLKSRRVRIEISNSSNEERRGGRMGRMGDQRREYSPERTEGDWRSARASEPLRDDDREGDRSGGGGGAYKSRGFERRDDMNRGERDSGFEDNKPGNWRDAPREPFVDRPRQSYRDSRPTGDDRDRGMGNRFSDRSGPRGMRDGRDSRDGRDTRDSSRERNGDRGNFGPRRNYDDMDKEKDRWGSVRSQPRENLNRGGSPTEPAPPMTRPKLELKPRTKPIEPIVPAKSDEPVKEEGESDVPSASTPATNIFGAAKPVDTAAKEREIEERLAARAKEAAEGGVGGGGEDAEKRGPREGPAWNRRNGDNRLDQERSRPTWRSNHDGMPALDRNPRDNRDSRNARNINNSSKPRDARSGSRGSSSGRAGPSLPRGPSSKQVDNRPSTDRVEREKKKIELTEEEEMNRMPKATDNKTPNFVASNKYSMLPDDVDPDDIDE